MKIGSTGAATTRSHPVDGGEMADSIMSELDTALLNGGLRNGVDWRILAKSETAKILLHPPKTRCAAAGPSGDAKRRRHLVL